jgi:hypothetical protein
VKEREEKKNCSVEIINQKRQSERESEREKEK